MNEASIGELQVFLSAVPAGRRERRLAIAAALVFALVFIALAPSASMLLPPVWAFIPSYESALAVNDLITAVLLFSQFAILSGPALLVLAAGYLFSSAMAVCHALSFPGLFSPTGLLGAGAQTTAWLYMFWHAGFPLAVIAATFLKSGNGTVRAPRGAVAAAVLGALALVALIVALTTAGQDALPAIMRGSRHTSAYIGVVATVWASSLVALAVLLWRRPHSVLNVWLMIVMCAWFADVGVSAVLSAGRFDLGFYAGRIFGLLASSFVLMALLLETGKLYAGIIGSFARERGERELRLREVERSQAAAEAANVAKSDFLARMSHEIRTPMNAVIGLSELALRTALDARQHDYLVKIKSSAMALLRIINDVLDFSKIEAGKLEIESADFDLRAVLDGVASVSALPAAAKGIELLFSIDPELPAMLVGDSLRLGQVLQNLAGNAVKFTERGEIVVAVRVAGRRGDALDLEFSVADTGIGMSEEVQTQLFRPFAQADRSITRRFGGSGLGLAISKELVEMMGGTIAVESAPGSGSTFRFALSLGVSPAPVARAPAAPAEFGDLRVLVVDDSAVARDILARMLAHWGIAVETASDGRQALAAVRQALAAGRPYELLLIDGRMPELDGVATARAVREIAPPGRQPVIVMVTAYGRDELKGEAKHVAIEAFLAKPITESTLFDAISSVFGRGVRVPRPRRSEAIEADRARVGGARVLLVDDNEINRQVGLETLADVGVSVDLAENGRQAVAKVLESGVAYDAVLMDVQMPEMDGFEATAAIRQYLSADRLPIIALTAHAMKEERQRCLAAGMNDHVAKPIDPAALVATLSRWIKPRAAEAPIAASARADPAPGRRESAAAAAEDDLPIALAPFDITAALVRVNGKRALLRKLILSFGDEFAQAVAQLRQLVGDGELDKARRLAHTLRSTAATLELGQVAAAARGIETSLGRGEVDAVAPMIAALDTALAPALAAIASLRRP